jgi:hypothetical protein
VLAIAKDKMAEGLAVDKAVDTAFAICTRQLQRHGYLVEGSDRPTEKGAVASMVKGMTGDAQGKRLEYEALLAAARQARAARKPKKGVRVDLDAIITEVTTGIDLDAIVESVVQPRRRRGAANRALALPGSRNADLCRELTKLRKAMDEVFACDTAFGTCRVEEGYPSAGHCMLAAMVVQDLFGGEILFGQVNNVPHYWNRVGKREIDVTGDQFGAGTPPVRAKQGRLNGDSTIFQREPGDSLVMPANAELMRLHERFVRRLAPVLRKQGNTSWAKQLSAEQRRRKAA